MLDRSVATGIRKQRTITFYRNKKLVNNWFVLLALSLVLLSNYVLNVYWNTNIVSANAEATTGRRIQKHNKFNTIDNTVDDDDDDKWKECTLSPAPSSSSDQPSTTPSKILLLNDNDDHKLNTQSNYTKVQMPLLRINITANDQLDAIIKEQEQLHNNNNTTPNDMVNNWMERFVHTFFKDNSRYRTSFVEINSDTVRWNDTITSKNISTTSTLTKNDIFEVSGYAIFKGTTILKKLDDIPKRVEPKKNNNKKSHPTVKEQKKMNNNKQKKEEKSKNRILTMDDMIVQRKVRTTSSIMSSSTRRTTTITTTIGSTIPSEIELEQIMFAYFSFWGTENLLSYIQHNNNIIGWDVSAVQVAVNGTIIHPQINTTSENNSNNDTTTTDNNHNNTNYIESIATDGTISNKSLLQNPPAVLMIAIGASIVVFGIAVVILLRQRRKSIVVFDDDNNSNYDDDDNSSDCTNNIQTGIMFDKKNYMKKTNLYPPIQDDDDNDDDDNNNDIMTVKSGSNRIIQTGTIGIARINSNYTTDKTADNDPDDTDSDSRSVANLHTLSTIDTIDTTKNENKTMKKNKKYILNNSPNEYLTTISRYGFVSLLAGSVSPRTKLNTILDVAEETSTDNEKSTHSRNNNNNTNKLPHRDKSGHSRCDVIMSETDDSDAVNIDDDVDVNTDHNDTNTILDLTKLPVVVDNVASASAAAPGKAEDEYIFFYTSQNKHDEQTILPPIQSSENTSTHQTIGSSSSSRVTTSSPVLVPDVPLQLMETNNLFSSTLIVHDVQTEYQPTTTGTAYEPASVRRQISIFPSRRNRRNLKERQQESTNKRNLISALQVSSMSKTASVVSESRNDVDNNDNDNNNDYPNTETPVELQPSSQSFLPVQQTPSSSTTTVPTVFAMDDEYIQTHDYTYGNNNELSTHSSTRRSRCNSMGSRVSVGYTTSDCDIVSIADDFSMRS